MTGLPPELVSAVLASPAEAAPRLACADWLDEHGDADAARLVRLQVRAARHRELRVSNQEVSRLTADADALAAANFGRWVLAPLGTDDPRGVAAGFRDGFVSWLAVNSRSPLPPEQVFDRLTAFPLLWRFEHRSKREVSSAILERLPLLSLLEGLTLHLTPPELGAAAVARLAALPALGHLSLRGGAEREWIVRPGEWGPLRDARLSRLRATPEGELLAAIRPQVSACRVSRVACRAAGMCP